MKIRSVLRLCMIGAMAATLAGCGGGGLFGGGRSADPERAERWRERAAEQETPVTIAAAERNRRSTIWDLFENADDPNVTVAVNRYLWNASLDVLNFLPVEAADPFSGVIVMGWGRPQGGGREYRATVYVTDPALDARSLKVALATRGGAAGPDTVRAIEDAILTRARQLRIRDGDL